VPDLYDMPSAYDQALPYNGGSDRVAKNYGTGRKKEQFRWSEAWERQFAEERRAKEVEQLADAVAPSLAAWREAEDDDLLLAAGLAWWR
jgi:hypothetical protein